MTDYEKLHAVAKLASEKYEYPDLLAVVNRLVGTEVGIKEDIDPEQVNFEQVLEIEQALIDLENRLA